METAILVWLDFYGFADRNDRVVFGDSQEGQATCRDHESEDANWGLSYRDGDS